MKIVNCVALTLHFTGGTKEVMGLDYICTVLSVVEHNLNLKIIWPRSSCGSEK
jgi:hypothetical protein